MLERILFVLSGVALGLAIALTIRDFKKPPALTFEKSEELSAEIEERYSKLVIICTEGECSVYKEEH